MILQTFVDIILDIGSLENSGNGGRAIKVKISGTDITMTS